MQKKALIVIQSPGEIAPNLCQYEQCLADGYDVYLVTFLKGIYDFLTLLHLNARILFLETLFHPIWYPINIFRNKNLMKNNIHLLKLCPNDTIDVFISSCIGWTIAGYLNFFIKSGYQIYRNSNDDAFIIEYKPNISIKYHIIAFITSILINFKCRAVYYDGFYGTVLDFRSYTIIDKMVMFDPTIYERYIYKLPSFQNDAKKVLFLTEPYRNRYTTKQAYDAMNVTIVNELKKRGYFVCMKGHPRIGSHPLLTGLVDAEIPSFLPSQFIDVRIFDFAVSFTSSSLCKIPIRSYSVLEMCDISDMQNKDYLKRILEEIDPGKIKYIKSFDEIDHLM